VSAGRRWGALAVLSASLLVVVMDLTILTIALPDLAADLRPSAAQQLWIIDSYSLVLAGLLVSMSALADRWGRRRMLLAGFVVFGGASALVLVARSAETVVAVRALLGIGGAMIMPTTLSMIRTVFTDPRERATALGVWSAVAALGAAVGPIVGGLLLENFGWRAAFLVNVPCMAVALVAGVLVLPEARDPALAERAKDAFVTAMADTSLVAGVVMLVVAAVVFRLVDRDLDPTRSTPFGVRVRPVGPVAGHI
jgi:DHA2 family multidrug resistance protein-like MFS transporter